MTGYRFLTTWLLAAPREQVWQVVSDVEQWPLWWPGVREARELTSPDIDGLGRRVRMRFRSRLGYSLSFTGDVVTSRPPELGEVTVDGQLRGRGRWELTRTGAGTRLDWTWEVTPEVRWMRALSPYARPLFVWAHADLMRRGRRGLARRLSSLDPPTSPRLR